MIDPKNTRPVWKLLEDITDSKYAIPYFQRSFEWTPSMVSDLLISIIQDYFTGLLLFWELDKNNNINDILEPLYGLDKVYNPDLVILDGQQRLSSLYYAIYGPQEYFPNRKTYYLYFLDLKNYMNNNFDNSIFYTFSFQYKTFEEIKLEREKWIEKMVIPIRLLSDRKFIDSEEFTHWLLNYSYNFIKNDNNKNETILINTFNKIKNSLLKILNYEFLIHVLGKDRELSDVCEIFARVNQKGMKLSTFDLMNAFLFPKNISLKKKWEDIDDEIKEVDSNMDELFLKLISLFKQEYCSSKYLFYLIPGYKIKKKDSIYSPQTEIVLIKDNYEFLEIWEKGTIYIKKALNIIKNVGKDDFGAIKNEFIPNTTIIIVLGAILFEFEENKNKYKVDEQKFKEIIKKWYWCAIISGDYSGSSDSIMSEDYRDLKKFLKDKEFSVIRRIKKIDKDFIEKLDLKNIRKGASIYKAILCLIALKGAKDFYTKRPVGFGTYINENIDDHHVFPKSLRKLNSESFEITKDSILNRTLLLDDTNNKIKDKNPSNYLMEIFKNFDNNYEEVKEVLDSHFINEMALNALKEDNYDLFIVERERYIKEVLKSLLDLK